MIFNYKISYTVVSSMTKINDDVILIVYIII
jgi:hypothetical protein